jgi:hypothetical protein
VILLVLAVVWGVLLASWLRSRTKGTFSDPVVTFRRHLSVLERATPTTVTPANRLRSGSIAGRTIPAYRSPSRPVATWRSGPPSRPGAGPGRSALRPPSAAGFRRRQAQRRRRDVLCVLLAGMVLTLLVAVVSGLSAVWALQVLFDMAFVAYVALLIRLRNLAIERDLKLAYLPPPVQARAARPRPAYDLGSANYGELALRRVAN